LLLVCSGKCGARDKKYRDTEEMSRAHSSSFAGTSPDIKSCPWKEGLNQLDDVVVSY
jgi:hypothetical protein